jgi:hypothetical protein
MNATATTRHDPSRGLPAFRVFLRVYGVLTLAIFVLLWWASSRSRRCWPSIAER